MPIFFLSIVLNAVASARARSFAESVFTRADFLALCSASAFARASSFGLVVFGVGLLLRVERDDAGVLLAVDVFFAGDGELARARFCADVAAAARFRVDAGMLSDVGWRS